MARTARRTRSVGATSATRGSTTCRRARMFPSRRAPRRGTSTRHTYVRRVPRADGRGRSGSLRLNPYAANGCCRRDDQRSRAAWRSPTASRLSSLNLPRRQPKGAMPEMRSPRRRVAPSPVTVLARTIARSYSEKESTICRMSREAGSLVSMPSPAAETMRAQITYGSIRKLKLPPLAARAVKGGRIYTPAKQPPD